jgi:hypothetical protein
MNVQYVLQKKFPLCKKNPIVENPKKRSKYNLKILNEIAKILDCSIRDFLFEKYL